ncbi:hypothetical protein Ade02nite_84720 [Paractinoplanes deccanensis]|uniref:GH16 domain-containing protein n=2 Tax=Paractinoplanes deccanensis TaxID=113561 RepID=A0ABQ3YIK3_9ACTN|nr:hypothetical protein Ade02nite_84720 [Actinoplanes deccanensis]
MAVALAIPLVGGLMGAQGGARTSPSPAFGSPGGAPAAAWTRRWSAAPAEVTGRWGAVWRPDTEIASGGSTRLADAGAAAQYRYARTGTPHYTLAVPRPGTYAITVATAPAPGSTRTRTLRVEAGADPVRTLRFVDQGGSPRRAMFLARTPALALRFRVAGADVVAVTATSALRDERPLAVKWADEFDGAAGTPPGGRWRAQTGATGWGNDELQDYTAGTANAALTGTGRLALTARREHGGRFTSARLRSTYEGTYGRIEGLIRMPAGAGLLPAFWTLGADIERVGWPQCGEVDLVESLGAAEPDRVHGTVHGPDGTRQGWAHGWTAWPPGGPAGGFHTYTLDWWPGVLQWSVDGVVHGVMESADMPAGRWVFEKPAFLLLSLAVGGRWPGRPPAATVFPQAMEVGSVRWLG